MFPAFLYLTASGFCNTWQRVRTLTMFYTAHLGWTATGHRKPISAWSLFDEKLKKSKDERLSYWLQMTHISVRTFDHHRFTQRPVATSYSNSDSLSIKPLGKHFNLITRIQGSHSPVWTQSQRKYLPYVYPSITSHGSSWVHRQDKLKRINKSI